MHIRKGQILKYLKPLSFKNKFTRRDFLYFLLSIPLFKLKNEKPVVGISSSKDPFERIYNSINYSTGEKPENFFSKALGKDSIIGIKLNCLAGKPLSPSPELVEALVEILKKSGTKEENIIVFERSDKELERAGFKINRYGKGYKCYGTNGDYDLEVEESGLVGVFFSKIVSKEIKYLINFGVLKDHDLAGISVGLKNYYGLINNPNKYHKNNCSPYVAHLANHPFIKNKHILTIIDGTLCQYNGGPAYNSKYIEELNLVISSKDIAACDFWALEKINFLRNKNGLKTLEEEKRAPAYLEEAVKINLTKADKKNFKIISD